MRLSSSSFGKAGYSAGSRFRRPLFGFTMAGIAWLVAAGTSVASLSAADAPRIAADMAFHRGDLAYRRGDLRGGARLVSFGGRSG